ncbi:hypothetical protein SH611_10665 [Geminicoccaceae bacterium 1502E]|nr:hypothetical protein [Geminicoccaceae bacterium 1502E]
MPLTLKPAAEALRLTGAARAAALPPPPPPPEPVLLATESGDTLVTDQGHALVAEAA